MFVAACSKPCRVGVSFISSNLTQIHARSGSHCLGWSHRSPMRNFQLKTVLKAPLLDEMASVYLLKLITWKRLSSIYKIPCAHDHYEANSAKHWISITLFLQGLNLLLTACFSTALPWTLSSHCIYFYRSIFHEKIGLISSIFAGKSMMARPEEQRLRWTEEEDRMLFECKSRNLDLPWPNIAELAGLSRSGKSCRERWKNHLDPDVKRGKFSKGEDDSIICFQSLYGNR